MVSGVVCLDLDGDDINQISSNPKYTRRSCLQRKAFLQPGADFNDAFLTDSAGRVCRVLAPCRQNMVVGPVGQKNKTALGLVPAYRELTNWTHAPLETTGLNAQRKKAKLEA